MVEGSDEWPIIRNRDLDARAVPEINIEHLQVDDDQWRRFDHFAVSFNGYDFSHLGPELALLGRGIEQEVEDGGAVPITDLTWLRALLFIKQREMRATYSGESTWPPSDARYVAALLQAIRRSIEAQPDKIGHLREEHVPASPAIMGGVVKAPREQYSAVWRFARTFDSCEYFDAEDTSDTPALVATGIRMQFAVTDRIADVGNLGILRACLAVEERPEPVKPDETPRVQIY